MTKYLILAFFAIVIAVPVAASYFLPWWGTLLAIVGEVIFLGITVPALVKYGFKKFAMGLFESKSKVLRKAQVELHRCEATTKPGGDKGMLPENDGSARELEREYGDTEQKYETRGYVLIDCTITPKQKYAVPMTHWDPVDFALVPYSKPTGINHMDEDMQDDEGQLASVNMVDSNGVELEDSEFDKIAGPMRLRFVFDCPESLVGRTKLRYYFEGIGDIRLP